MWRHGGSLGIVVGLGRGQPQSSGCSRPYSRLIGETGSRRETPRPHHPGSAGSRAPGSRIAGPWSCGSEGQRGGRRPQERGRSAHGAVGRWGGGCGAEFAAGRAGSARHTSRGPRSRGPPRSGAPGCHTVHHWAHLTAQPGGQVHTLTSPWPPRCAPAALRILCRATGWVPGSSPPPPPPSPCLFFPLPRPAPPTPLSSSAPGSASVTACRQGFSRCRPATLASCFPTPPAATILWSSLCPAHLLGGPPGAAGRLAPRVCAAGEAGAGRRRRAGHSCPGRPEHSTAQRSWPHRLSGLPPRERRCS